MQLRLHLPVSPLILSRILSYIAAATSNHPRPKPSKGFEHLIVVKRPAGGHYRRLSLKQPLRLTLPKHLGHAREKARHGGLSRRGLRRQQSLEAFYSDQGHARKSRVDRARHLHGVAHRPRPGAATLEPH